MSVAAGSLYGGWAEAQQAADTAQNGLQEVVVTAERRTTRIQDTPISVSAITTEKMDAEGIRSIDDLTRITPGITFQRVGLTSSGNYNDEDSDIAIRGIDSSAGASTTGIYVDDTPIQTRHLSFGTVNAFPALFDLDRVEVLRGPQGTLFGAGSEGGTVRFITPEPSLTDYTGYFRTELGSTENGDPSYEVAGAVGGPIVPGTLGFRLSASVRDDGGYVDRVAYDPATLTPLKTLAENTNWERTATIRGALKFAVTDNLTITPSIYYQQLYLNDTGAYWPALSDRGNDQLRSGNVQGDTSFDPFYIAAVKTEWNAGWAEFTSNTSYFSRDQKASTDYTQFLRTIFLGLPYPVEPSDKGTAWFTDTQRNFTEEVRAQSTDDTAPLTWVAGIYFNYSRENTLEQVGDPNLITEFPYFTDPPPFPNGIIYVQNPFREIDRQVALYAQADYKITPELKVTAGVRVASYYTEGDQYYAGPFVGPEAGTAKGSFTEYPVTPKFGVEYQPDKDDLFYASVAKGYRPGGINAGLSTLCAGNLSALGLTGDPANFASDSLWSYELGAKNTLLGGKLQLSGSVFYIDWSNIQQSVYLSLCGLQFVANLGEATSKGFDFSAQYRAAPGLLLSLEGGYTDAYYAKTVYAGTGGAGAPVVTAGDLLAPSPWNIDASIEYDPPMDGNYDPYIRADYQFSSAQDGLSPYQDPNNASSDITIPGAPSTSNLSLRAGLRWTGYDVSLFANNALDSLPVLVRSRDTTYSPLYFEHTWRPRTIGVTATYRF
jgi:outer membrane receptor protein involved in Fe transport